MRILPLLLAMSFVLAACGSDSGSLEDGPLDVPDGTEGGVILEIAEEGGFVPIEVNLQRVSRFTVFNDGTVVKPTGQQFSFPGPVVIPLVEYRIADDVMADLLAFIDDAGLADQTTIDLNDAPNVADATTTVVRYFDEAGEHRISIYALGFDGGTDARTAIVESMISTLEEATTGAGAAYQPARLTVFVQEATSLGLQQPRNGGEWPLAVTPADLPIADDVNSIACTTLEGQEAQDALSALAVWDSVTTFDFEGAAYRLLTRPLLPHQDEC